MAQQTTARPSSTPSRVVVTSNLPATPRSTPLPRYIPTPTAAPRVSPTPIIVGQDPGQYIPERTSTPTTPQNQSPVPPLPNSMASNLSYKGMSFSQIKSKIAEAKREMMSRPMTIGSTEPTTAGISYVRVAYIDSKTHNVEYVIVSKNAFLALNTATSALSTSGRMMTLRNIRANGVNTPVMVIDENGKEQTALVIQYPVEKNGRFVETAYYTSTHPGLITPEVVNAGRFYVHNVIEIAREKLRSVGYSVQPKVADMAERLATVEHVDHQRFRTEFQPNIFNDIFTLYALNEGQTYRYSVSSAGAGGMVQMIPSTYRMIRARYPNANLMYDFVEGMRNHVNAAQAMLLYMQMTWSDLASNPAVAGALASGIARPEQLMAAGYNSNPAKLAGYINRGGAGWTSLIPRETQMYLQIYSSLEQHVTMQPRTF